MSESPELPAPLAALAAAGRVAPDWAAALAPVAAEIAEIARFCDAERAAGYEVLPTEDRIFRAFERPLSAARVLVLGQDPYPTPGHAMGLAFSAEPEVQPLPRSLANLFRELHDDLGIAPAIHGDLSAWSGQGVLLLNRVLTVRAGDAGSHRNKGWERVTDRAIDALVARGGPLVAVLWGNDARALAPRLEGMPIIESAHPSPLSARRGFFGSKPFSRVNEELAHLGAAPIDWTVGPSQAENQLW
ncbi:uracil-DNA glycosylase [Leucobacter exalbidus]|uniref:uracil-DNA glycosylase n=1 Tax=Leucobacter exalbidus TaxID=662960 RepID=UPI001FD728A8|nr:uracil-DNA glycosylase [Leucobacter exalbidus]